MALSNHTFAAGDAHFTYGNLRGSGSKEIFEYTAGDAHFTYGNSKRLWLHSTASCTFGGRHQCAPLPRPFRINWTLPPFAVGSFALPRRQTDIGPKSRPLKSAPPPDFAGGRTPKLGLHIRRMGLRQAVDGRSSALCPALTDSANTKSALWFPGRLHSNRKTWAAAAGILVSAPLARIGLATDRLTTQRNIHAAAKRLFGSAIGLAPARTSNSYVSRTPPAARRMEVKRGISRLRQERNT